MGVQYGHGLLLVPGDIAGEGQLINVVQEEDFLEFQGDLKP
jgi:hypothetical protein